MHDRRAIKRIAAALVLLTAVTAAAGCGGSKDDGQLVVFAASSLTDVFDELATQFELGHPGVDVVINAQGSAQLAAQIEQGAPADVFASADQATMDRVRGEVSGVPATFARNELVIAVATGNPLGVAGLADLATRDLIVVVAAPEVPAGAYAAQAFEQTGVVLSAASYEQNVRSVAAKVALGEADAGIVYLTDVVADETHLDAISIDVDLDIEYPIVAVSDDDSAQPFVEFVLSETGRAVLERAGFGAP